MAEKKRRSTASGDETKARIIEAAITTLRDEGIVGTSARVIAKNGDFNQALIFYHFGSVDDLVVAAVARISAIRMENHRPRLEEVSSLTEMIEVARELHADDRANDNIKVLTQAVAGAAMNDELGPKIYAELEPWTDLVTGTIERIFADVPAAAAIDKAHISQAIGALFLGIELLDGLDENPSTADAIFDTLQGLSRLGDLVLQMPGLAGLTNQT